MRREEPGENSFPGGRVAARALPRSTGMRLRRSKDEARARPKNKPPRSNNGVRTRNLSLLWRRPPKPLRRALRLLEYAPRWRDRAAKRAPLPWPRAQRPRLSGREGGRFPRNRRGGVLFSSFVAKTASPPSSRKGVYARLDFVERTVSLARKESGGRRSRHLAPRRHFPTPAPFPPPRPLHP